MSYILDALKKAEQERRRGKAPDIMTTPEGSSSRQQKHLWPYAVLIMLVAAAGSVGWFFGHEKADTATPIPLQGTQNYVVPVHPQTQVTAQPAAPLTEAAPPTQPTTTSGGNQAEKEEKSTSTNTTLGPLNDKRNLSKSQAMQQPAHSKGTSTKIKPGPVITSKSSQDGVSEEIRPQPEKKMVPDNKIYAINELPEAVRQGLPSITISTHIYSSDKSERLSAINGHIGREGQEVITGITLESITPDGVILRYQGYKFRIGLK
jgi:general secretion pathway protein B